MSGPAAVWSQVADAFGAALDQVTDENRSASTPCEEWDVDALLEHTVSVQAQSAALFAGSPPPDASDWPAVRAMLESALSDPSALEGEAPPEAGPMAGMPKHQVLGITIMDLLLHTWDLAQAVDADVTLPPAAVEAAWMGIQRFPEPMLRSSGMFAAAVEVADDASTQDKLLAYAGRQP
jgi:uncharacterized protein (TIGR03086 family)